MGQTYISDLNIQFNKVYIFRDQPKCDHMIVFTDLEVNSYLDVLQTNEFPFEIFQAKIKKRLCNGCDTRFARYVTRKDKLTNQNLSFYCETCHKDLDSTNIQGKNNVEIYRYMFE